MKKSEQKKMPRGKIITKTEKNDNNYKKEEKRI